MSKLDLSRRDFLALSALTSVAHLPAWALQPLAVPKAANSCALTESQQLGPYYREGALRTQSLAAATEPGDRIRVSGNIYGGSGCQPLADVTLDVWQADASGKYDFQDAPQPRSPLNYRLRGQVLSNARGRYEFTSIRPGNYETRAKHIHFLVRRSGYEPLITQLYFAGDPKNHTDTIVKPSLIRVLEPRADGLPAVLPFDIVLQREIRWDPSLLRRGDDYVGEYAFKEMGGFIAKIAWANGALRLDLGVGDVAAMRLVPVSASRFRAPDLDGTVTFIRNERDEVGDLLLEIYGVPSWRGKRMP